MNSTTSSLSLVRPSKPWSAARRAPKAQPPDVAAQEAELIRQFVAGDEAAFLEIMNRYRGRIFAIVHRLLSNLCDAEEITQDTFIRAHRCLKGFRRDSSLYTWLRRIAVNLAHNRYWYNHRRRQHATLSLDSQLREDSTATVADLIATRELGPVRTAAVGEFNHLVEACMAHLSAQQREVLVRHSMLHHSYDDITQSLGISGGTVKSRMSRARESLRKLLEKQCPEFRTGSEPSAWFEAVRDTGNLALAVA